MQVTWGFEQHYEGVVSDQQRPKCVLEPLGRPEEFIRTLLDGLLRNVTALQARHCDTRSRRAALDGRRLDK